jgi:hypothetical protein
VSYGVFIIYTIVTGVYFYKRWAFLSAPKDGLALVDTAASISENQAEAALSQD